MFEYFIYFIGQYIYHITTDRISSKSTSPLFHSFSFSIVAVLFLSASAQRRIFPMRASWTVVHESSRNVANFLDLTLNTWILLSSSPLCFPLLSPFIPPVVRFKRFSRRHWRENLNFEKERKVISRLPFNLHRDHGTCGWVFFTDTYFRLTWRLLLPLFEGGDKKFLTELILLGKVPSTRISLSYYYLRIYFTQFLIARSISFQRRVD